MHEIHFYKNANAEQKLLLSLQQHRWQNCDSKNRLFQKVICSKYKAFMHKS